jgi:hypothetical protein
VSYRFRCSLAFLLLSACGGKKEPDVDPGGGDGGAGGVVELPADCDAAEIPAKRFECAGLYTNIEKKSIAKNAREYAPAQAFWSDGNEKHRWIVLPEGEKIDASDPSEWSFPLGTKLFKEFKSGGKRLETRLFEKKPSGVWAHATYAWNDDETDALISGGEEVPDPVNGTHEIPTGAQCDQCHKGRHDRVLGFEQISLGLEGATGLTLEKLVDEDLIDPKPERTSLEIGDDGTHAAAPAFRWLHVNCGVTCHNDNPDALASSASMRLRLDPDLLDGRSSADFQLRTTTIDSLVNNPNWHGETRIVPGDSDQSLLVRLISTRLSTMTDEKGDNGQMPPIATRVVDAEHVDVVKEWINAMGAEVR